MTAGVDGKITAEELMTPEEVCQWFKVEKDWLYDEVQAGRLPYFRIGRKHLRFSRTELLAYLESRASRPASIPDR